MDPSMKRKRGRPVGTGLPGDIPLLEKAADLMVATPTMRKTTAFRRLGVKEKTPLRRLQGKWLEDGERYLAEARQRQAYREKIMAEMPTQSSRAPCAVRQHIDAVLLSRMTPMERQAAQFRLPEMTVAQRIKEIMDILQLHGMTPMERQAAQFRNMLQSRDVTAFWRMVNDPQPQNFTDVLRAPGGTSLQRLLDDFKRLR